MNMSPTKIYILIALLLDLVFAALKLTGVIKWSWWWASMPWGVFGIVAVVLFVALLFFTDWSK